MQVREGLVGDLSEDEYIWLRDHHPRGPMILDVMRAREKDAEVEDEEEEVPPYEQWSFNELRAEAKTRNLDASGSKEDLIERLNANDLETQS